MNTPETISLYKFFALFPNEDAARKHFEFNRWGNGIECAHCGSGSVSECRDHRPMPYRCKDCRKHFSVRTGTALAESRLPLAKWLLAIYMMTTARKGFPSTQLARELGTTQKTAWFLAQRIRETWMKSNNENGGGDMGPDVQVDETFIGGKEKNKHSSRKLRQGRGSVGKEPVIGVIDSSGKVKAEPIKRVDGATVKAFIQRNIRAGSVVVTDKFPAYRGMIGYTHKTVNHSVGEYIRDRAHTNGIESFWALLKRGYYGVYHYMSPKHLNRYVNEFCFRQNTANCGTLEFINMTISKMVNCRINYKELTNG